MTVDAHAVPPAASGSKRVVIAPDLLGASLFDPDAAQVIALWRDGVIRPVLNRQLLLRYLKLLKRLGLSATLIRWWGWWLTGPDRTVLVDSADLTTSSTTDLCDRIAQLGGAACVVFRSTEVRLNGPASTEKVPPWFSAQRFLKAVVNEP